MPLHIRIEKGLSMPVVVCDHCLNEIKDAKEGNYQWRVCESWEHIDGTIYFTHKKCCRAFEHTNGGGTRWMAIGLECLPVYLANNLKIDWKKAKETAATMGSL